MDNKPLTYSAIIIAAVAIGAALKFMAPVMVPFAIALFFYYIFAPFTDYLKTRLKVPHAGAVILTEAPETAPAGGDWNRGRGGISRW